MALANGKKKKRKQHGTMLALTAVSTVFLIILGIGLFVIMRITGGSREVQNATDSGSLNVAKQALITPCVKITNADELRNFGDLIGSDQLVTLKNYNRIVARALLVALNAQDGPTRASRAHAKAIHDMADRIGKALRAKLTGQDSSSSDVPKLSFDALAAINSIRMASHETCVRYSYEKYSTAFVDRGEASNVYLDIDDPSLLKRLNNQNALITVKGKKYFRGYQIITINLGGGTNLTFCFVPMHPGECPHLIAQKEFDKNKILRISNVAPPNSFQTASTTNAAINHANMLAAQSCSVVGTLDQIFKYTMPQGYVTVKNPPGIWTYPTAPGFDTIFAHELMRGIYLVTDSSGKPLAFSTNTDILDKWIEHNAHPDSVPAPKLKDEDGNSYVFDREGNPASLDLLGRLTTYAEPSSGCNCYNISGPNGPLSPVCKELLAAFLKAYPHNAEQPGGNKIQVIAVERYRQLIGEAFARYQPLVGDTNDPNDCQWVSAPREVTGLRQFDHNHNYGTPWCSTVPISTPAPAPTYIAQVGGGAQAALESLYTRIMQIKPEVTRHELFNLLMTQPLELDTLFYIYMEDPTGTRKLIMTKIPPSPLSASGPDDTPQVYTSGWYPTNQRATNPFWDVHPDWYMWGCGSATVLAAGKDDAIWTASSGFEGCLGELSFNNRARGDGLYCCPN